MNVALAREIYGQPWNMDFFSYQAYGSLLKDFQNGVVLEIPQLKFNSYNYISKGPGNRLVQNPYQLDNNEDFEGVGLIRLDGPITRKGGMSSYGMVELSAMMMRMAKDDRIKSFIVHTDSGGGASAAVDILADTILEIDADKPVYGHIEKGGMAASAAFGILTACRSIHAADKMSIVGSCGTMIQFDGRSANTEDPEGVKHIRLYATKSIRKNESFEQALNNDDYEIIVNDLLDPVNQKFLKQIVKNRPVLKGTKYDDGHHVFAKDGVGSFIDGFMTFDQMVDSAFKNSNSTVRSKSNINQKSKTMTVEELKQNHPATYNSIFNAGVAAEKDRTGSWLAHLGTDQKIVVEGIKSGEEISATKREELLVAATAKQGLKNLEKDSSEAVNTPETKPTTNADEAVQKQEEEALATSIKSHLKKTA